VTAQELINQALRSIGALASGESPSTEESNDALAALNQLLASWSSQALPIYQITRTTVTLTGAASYTLATRPVKIKAASISTTATMSVPLAIATAREWAEYLDKASTADFPEMLFYEDGYPHGRIHIAPIRAAGGSLELISERAIGQGTMTVRELFSLTGAASYTIGVGGTFSTERPVKITGAAIQAGSLITRDLALVTAEQWAAYPKKGVAGAFAQVLYHDGGFPTATIWIAPKPAAGTLELYTYEKLAAIATLATNINLPEGYERALSAALGVELAPEYGRPLDGALQQKSEDAKTSIFGLNAAVLGRPEAAAQTPPPASPVPPPQPPQE
jgi:hypothetical protein